MSVREWTHDGDRILLPVLILAPLPTEDLSGVDVIGLLDTGATASGITRKTAQALGLHSLGKMLLGSARGEVMVDRYLFRMALRLPSAASEPPTFPFVFEESVGFELGENARFDALIGMDILSQCTFSMDRQRRCRLAFGASAN